MGQPMHEWGINGLRNGMGLERKGGKSWKQHSKEGEGRLRRRRVKGHHLNVK